MTQYCVSHQEGIKKIVDELFEEAKSNPILAAYIAEAKLDATRQFVAESMNESYEDVATVIDQNFMEKFIGA